MIAVSVLPLQLPTDLTGRGLDRLDHPTLRLTESAHSFEIGLLLPITYKTQTTKACLGKGFTQETKIISPPFDQYYTLPFIKV